MIKHFLKKSIVSTIKIQRSKLQLRASKSYQPKDAYPTVVAQFTNKPSHLTTFANKSLDN
jgi:hypothetical protein